MRKEYDFGSARRGAVVPAGGKKTRITIRIDDTILDWFREQVADSGGNYQSLINDALRAHIQGEREPLEAIVRRLVKEELGRAKALPKKRRKAA